MYCKKCGIAFDDKVKFCNQCGSDLISDMEWLGQATAQGQDGAFEELYWKVEAKVRRYLYHRVPVNDLQKCVEEAYDGLLSTIESYEGKDQRFSQWFNRYLYRYALRYTGLHNIFTGEEPVSYAPKYELEDMNLRIERDITMGEEKRIDLLNYILVGVTEKERICISQHYIEKMPVDMIASAMHTRPVVIEYYLATGCDKMRDNLEEYQKEYGGTLFGMSEMAFIIWIMQYDDMSHVINPKEVLNHVKQNATASKADMKKAKGMAALAGAATAALASKTEAKEKAEETKPVAEKAPEAESIQAKAAKTLESVLKDDEDEYDEEYVEYVDEEEESIIEDGEFEEDDVFDHEKSTSNMRNLTYQDHGENKEYVPAEYENSLEYDDSDFEDMEEERNEETSSAVKVGNVILKILIAACIVVLVGLCALIASNLLSKDEEVVEEATTEAITTEATAEVKTEAKEKKEDVISYEKANKAFMEFMEKKKLGRYFYAVIEAGEKESPILIYAQRTPASIGDTYQPSVKDKGYTIEGIYAIIDNQIVQIAKEVKQPARQKAWRLYQGKLSSYTEDGIRTLDITGDSCKFKKETEVPDDYAEEAEIIALSEFKGTSTEVVAKKETTQATKATTEATQEATTKATTEKKEESTKATTEKKKEESTKATTEKKKEESTKATTESTKATTEVVATEEEEEIYTEEPTYEELPEEPTQSAGRTVEVTSSDGTLNVRESPSSESAKIYSLETGDWVSIVRVKGNWGELASGGWINLSYTRDVE